MDEPLFAMDHFEEISVPQRDPSDSFRSDSFSSALSSTPLPLNRGRLAPFSRRHRQNLPHDAQPPCARYLAAAEAFFPAAQQCHGLQQR